MKKWWCSEGCSWGEGWKWWGWTAVEIPVGPRRYLFSPNTFSCDTWKEHETDNWLTWLLAHSLPSSCGILGKSPKLSEPLLHCCRAGGIDQKRQQGGSTWPGSQVGFSMLAFPLPSSAAILAFPNVFDTLQEWEWKGLSCSWQRSS